VSGSDSPGRQHLQIAGLWMSALPLGEMWHTGIVVADLDAAVADFRSRSGVRFTDPHIVPLTIRQRDAAGLADVRVRTVMSLGTPPYLELIEAIPGTVYSAGQVHLGFWSDGLPAAVAAMTEAGCPQVMCDTGADDAGPDMMSYHQTPGGYVIEVVAPYLRPLVEQHMAGGPAPRSRSGHGARRGDP
jgi:hypothetical protein